MALESLWVTLKSDVTDVSAVQASIHAGYGCNGAETADVSAVTAEVATMCTVTAETAAILQALQRKPAPVLACTPDTAVTCKKIVIEANTANELLTSDLLAQPADPDRNCYPHTEACNTGELALMATRLETFNRLGIDIDQAEKLADRLKDRDREHDDRHACLECVSLSGGIGGWRCMAFRQRGARDPGLGDLAMMLQRCPTFTSGEPSTSGYYTTARPANEPMLLKQDRAPGPWLTASETAASKEYHTHHANCPQCQAAGRGHVSHCSVGMDLWTQYQQEGTSNE
ncbi:MAG: hypothetical protein IPH35_15310 [Rhodoferax sp.]|nr:hypothetical protein [Rhodoferax sp.]